MTLYLIGIGLANEKDITVRGLEIVKKCDIVYLEYYTSLLQCSFHDLAKFYDKEIILADRKTTEQGDEKIIAEAKARWSILDATVIHRIGEMKAEEQIVFVAVASLHRQDAFSACEFIMDYLKTRAPFWKKCRDESGESWVETKASDQEAEKRW